MIEIIYHYYMEVIIKNLKDEPVCLYNPKNQLIGEIKTAASFVNVRYQIALNELSGYYIKFRNKRIDILPSGKCQSYPNGLFDSESIETAKLFGLILNKRKSSNKNE